MEIIFVPSESMKYRNYWNRIFLLRLIIREKAADLAALSNIVLTNCTIPGPHGEIKLPSARKNLLTRKNI